jgi:hypothetical protein
MASLEHSLQDITGSIKRQAQAATPVPATHAAVMAAPPDDATPAPATAKAAALTAPTPTVAAAKPAAATAEPTPAAAKREPVVAKPAPAVAKPTPPAPAPAVAVEPASPPQVEVASRQPPEEVAEEPKPEIGVDVGGAVNFDGLRALWKSVQGSHASLFEDMHPVVIVREASHPRGVELRLIAGPVTDVEAADKICAVLTAARRFCRPTEFEGQAVSLMAPERHRRPANAAPERRRSPTPVPRPSARR